MKRKKILLTMIVTLAMAAAMLAPAGNAEAPEVVTIGLTAPDFEIELLCGDAYRLNEDGSEPEQHIFRLSEQVGKVVIINFWATWCPPCRAEMPDIELISQDFADNVVVIGVDMGEDSATVQEFIENNQYTYNFAIDFDYDLMESYPTSGIPYTIVVDMEGKVSDIRLGYTTYDDFSSMVKTAMLATGGE